MLSSDMLRPDFLPPERLDERRTMQSRRYEHHGMAAAYYRRDGGGEEPLGPNPVMPAFQFVIPLATMPAHGGWMDGKRIELPAHEAGAPGFFDWRRTWSADLRDPFEALVLVIPQAAMDELTDGLGGRRIARFDCPAEQETRFDPHAFGLAQALLPLLTHPHEAGALFADYIFGACRLHFAVAYGGLKVSEARRTGRLAPWQERRATEMMLADLGADISVEVVATACGLSARHFERAFTVSFGAPPHRWRLKQRVERARRMLEEGDEPLALISAVCGFADQSHFTRVFRRFHDTTPAGYRRRRRG